MNIILLPAPQWLDTSGTTQQGSEDIVILQETEEPKPFPSKVEIFVDENEDYQIKGTGNPDHDIAILLRALTMYIFARSTMKSSSFSLEKTKEFCIKEIKKVKG